MHLGTYLVANCKGSFPDIFFFSVEDMWVVWQMLHSSPEIILLEVLRDAMLNRQRNLQVTVTFKIPLGRKCDFILKSFRFLWCAMPLEIITWSIPGNTLCKQTCITYSSIVDNPNILGNFLLFVGQNQLGENYLTYSHVWGSQNTLGKKCITYLGYSSPSK